MYFHLKLTLLHKMKIWKMKNLFDIFYIVNSSMMRATRSSNQISILRLKESVIHSYGTGNWIMMTSVFAHLLFPLEHKDLNSKMTYQTLAAYSSRWTRVATFSNCQTKSVQHQLHQRSKVVFRASQSKLDRKHSLNEAQQMKQLHSQR